MLYAVKNILTQTLFYIVKYVITHHRYIRLFRFLFCYILVNGKLDGLVDSMTCLRWNTFLAHSYHARVVKLRAPFPPIKAKADSSTKLNYIFFVSFEY